MRDLDDEELPRRRALNSFRDQRHTRDPRAVTANSLK